MPNITTKVKKATSFYYDGTLANLSNLIKFVNDSGFDFNQISTSSSGNVQSGSSVASNQVWSVSGSYFKKPVDSSPSIITYQNFNWSSGYITLIEGQGVLGFYKTEADLLEDFDEPAATTSGTTTSA